MRTFQALVHGAVVAAAIGLAATSAFGFSSIGNDVNAFCGSNPYTGDCNLCHASQPAFDAARSGDFCYFCPGDAQCTTPEPACTDADGDGYFAEADCGTPVDCNDNDRRINPGAAEVCTDARDNDCNGAIDGQDDACIVVSPPPCSDGDGDGWCAEDGDCNDDDPEIFPGAIDVCLDGIDQDCSGADRTQGADCPQVTPPPTSGDGGSTSDDPWRGDDDEYDDEHDGEHDREYDDDHEEREYSRDRERRSRRWHR
jgi:hypothetical protein